MPAMPSWLLRASTIVSSAEPLSSDLLCATCARFTQVNRGPTAPQRLGLSTGAAGPRVPLVPVATQPVLLMVSLTALACRTRRRSSSRARSHARWLLMVRCSRHIAPVPRTARERMVARLPRARTLAFTACGGLLRAVVRASQTDLACARARPLAGHFGAVRSPRIPTRAACRRSGINPSRCARARRWRARPLPRPRARACPLSPHSRTARAFAHRRYEWPCLEGVETGWNACCIAR